MSGADCASGWGLPCRACCRRDDHEAAAADGVADRVVDTGAGPPVGAADAHVDHLRAVVGRVADAARHDVVGAFERAAEDEVPVPSMTFTGMMRTL